MLYFGLKVRWSWERRNDFINGEMAHVVGEAGDGTEAVRLVDELKPDVVVMDLTMPILNGIDATREIAKNIPKYGYLYSQWKMTGYIL